VFGGSELCTLEEMGIEPISLDYGTAHSTDENGNKTTHTSTVKWLDGDTSAISEFWLASDAPDANIQSGAFI
jgi:hypothetical protein